MSFYNLTEAQRIARTETAAAEKRTLHERWAALGNLEAAAWSERAAMAAEYLKGSSAIVDLGCGTMILERYLRREGIRYLPVDVCKRDDRTIVCDFNIDPVPATSAEAAACLGLLEYLYDVPAFMKALHGLYKTCVVSYCITDAPEPLQPRKSHAWVNDFDRVSMTAILEDAGWRVEWWQPVDKIQVMWLLRRQD